MLVKQAQYKGIRIVCFILQKAQNIGNTLNSLEHQYMKIHIRLILTYLQGETDRLQ